jgi:copper chaperone
MKIELNVPDMSCGHCISSITKAAHGVDGAAKVDVDLAARRVRIESIQPQAQFINAIAEAGFTPAPVA